MTASIIIAAIIIVMIAAAVKYIIKEKKRGVKCVGCPLAGQCSGNNHVDDGCSCHGEIK